MLHREQKEGFEKGLTSEQTQGRNETKPTI